MIARIISCIPAACERIKFSCSSSSLSLGMTTSAKLPNPVLTPYTIFPAFNICTTIKESHDVKLKGHKEGSMSRSDI